MKRLLVLLLGVSACHSPDGGRLPPLADTAAYREARQLVGSGRFPAAALAYARIRDSFARAGDEPNAWFGQLWWTETMTRAGQPDSAARGLVLAREMSKENPRRLGWVAVMESHALERRGALDSAIMAAERAIESYRRTGDGELGVFAYDALGTPLSRRGRYRDALAADSTSLALRQAIPLSQRVIASGWNEVAIGYRHLGRFDDAETALKTSHALAQEQHDTLAMSLALANLSNVRNDTGDRDAAIATLLQAIQAWEEIKHRRLLNEGYNDLAGLYLEAGKPELAAAPAARALEGGRAMSNRGIEISALEMLGRVELARGRAGAAGDSLARGLALADQLGFGAERVSGRIGLVNVAIAEKNAVSARRHSDEAVRIADSLRDPAIQFNAVEARARALELTRDPGATQAFEAALDLLESIRGRLALGDLRMGVATPRIGVYESAILARLARGQVLEAFAIAERARGRLLLEIIAARGLRFGGTSLDSLRQRLREAFDSRANVRESAATARLDQRIASLSDSLQRTESTDPLFAGRPAGPHRIRQALLKAPRGMLAWFWGEKQVIGWWLTDREAKAVVLGSADSLATTVNFLAAALVQPSLDTIWRGAARVLFQRLVAPLNPSSVGELVILADGPLNRIPVEVILGDQSVPSRITYGPSASVLATLTDRNGGTWAKQILIVGNPNPGQGFGSLPFAESEARAVGELFRESHDVLIGSRATVPRWLSLEPGRYRYLHFAVHAQPNEQFPEKTALFFTDGSLLLSSIRRLHLTAELVSLSACETAVGRWVRGEGVIGLPYAFLAAGARATLVTFWRVPDQSAAAFTEEFYREIRAGRSPAEALARVKAAWRSTPGERSHPSRWAAFALVGISA